MADMQGIARRNGKMKYLLIVIDVLFKFAWAIPVHSKDAKAIKATLAQVLTTANPHHAQLLQNDNRNTFFNLDI